MGFELDPSYKDVATRIADFREKHPDGCLRPVDEKEPYRVECIDSRYFIVYTAAAYRTPDDPRPGVGVAWEPFPGRTPYTTNSELQNAETSAWGRAIIAVLASESKAIASAEDVRNRKAEAEAQPLSRFVNPDGELIEVWPGEVSVNDAKAQLFKACDKDRDASKAAWTAAGLDGKWKVTDEQLASLLAEISAPTGEGSGSRRAGPEPTEGAHSAMKRKASDWAEQALAEDVANDAMHAYNNALLAVKTEAEGITEQQPHVTEGSEGP